MKVGAIGAGVHEQMVDSVRNKLAVFMLHVNLMGGKKPVNVETFTSQVNHHVQIRALDRFTLMFIYEYVPQTAEKA